MKKVTIYIKIYVKFLESDNIFDMEAISNNGIENFIQNYATFSFKCTKIDYHKNGNVKSMENKIKNENKIGKENEKVGFKNVRIIEEIQNKLDMEKEFMMLGLRKLDGISISKFEQKFGENPIYLFRNELQKLVEEDLLEVDLDDIKLTSKGLDLANLVWEEFV